MRRLHRWVGGDWQLLPWLWPRVRSSDGSLGRNRLGSIQRWKMLDNLRRSVQPPITLLLLVAAWVGLLPGAVWVWTLLLVATQAAPLWCELLGLVTRATTKPTRAWSRLRAAPMTLRRALAHDLRSEEHTSELQS